MHTLMELAWVYGLEMIEMNNMGSFYQDHGYYFAALLKEQARPLFHTCDIMIT